jgi:hypothetical protein
LPPHRASKALAARATDRHRAGRRRGCCDADAERLGERERTGQDTGRLEFALLVQPNAARDRRDAAGPAIEGCRNRKWPVGVRDAIADNDERDGRVRLKWLTKARRELVQAGQPRQTQDQDR